jgi:hypothetical protein
MKLRPGLYRIPDVAVFLGVEPPDVPDTSSDRNRDSLRR